MQKEYIYCAAQCAAVKIPYLFYTPENFRPLEEVLPMIVSLRGAEERGTSPRLLTCHSLPMLCEGELPVRCLVLSPQCGEGKDRYWYLPYLMEMIDSIAVSCRADPDRIALTGVGHHAWEWAYAEPLLLPWMLDARFQAQTGSQQ